MKLGGAYNHNPEINCALISVTSKNRTEYTAFKRECRGCQVWDKIVIQNMLHALQKNEQLRITTSDVENELKFFRLGIHLDEHK